MNKVAVPKEIHDAIEYFKHEQGDTIASIYDRIVKVDHIIAQTTEEYKAHNDLKRWFNNNTVNQSQLMRILVRGTKVELTPEEVVKNKYNELKWKGDSSAEVIYMQGMKFVLNAYNIKIKGVNE